MHFQLCFPITQVVCYVLWLVFEQRLGMDLEEIKIIEI